MLSKFDWLRLCRTGAELLATISYFSENPAISLPKTAQGSPFSAIGKLCLRCKLYAPASDRGKRGRFCKFCNKILGRTRKVAFKSPHAIVLWGFMDHIPRQLRESKKSNLIYGIYVHDEQRFLLMMQRRRLREWLQELVIYYGVNLKGLIQIFPTLGVYRNLNMGDYLNWAIHHEANLPLNQLWIRLFTVPNQLINPKKQEREGLFSFNVSEFLGLLEMAEVFRANLHPDEQKDLYDLLNLGDPTEEKFYWGRFLGQLTQEAKDMLSSWKIRQWPQNRIKLLYKLIDYVVLPQSS